MQFREVVLIFLALKAKIKKHLKPLRQCFSEAVKKALILAFVVIMQLVHSLVHPTHLLLHYFFKNFRIYCNVEVKYNDHMKEVHKNYLLIV